MLTVTPDAVTFTFHSHGLGSQSPRANAAPTRRVEMTVKVATDDAFI